MHSVPARYRRSLLSLALASLLTVGGVCAPVVALADEIDDTATTEVTEALDQEATASETEEALSMAQDVVSETVVASTDEGTPEVAALPSNGEAAIDEVVVDQFVDEPGDAVVATGDVIQDQADETAPANEGDSQESAVIEDGPADVSSDAPVEASEEVPEESPTAETESRETVNVASDNAEEGEVIGEGSYVFSSALSKKMVINVKDKVAKSGSNVDIATANGTASQRWTVRHVRDGLYNIVRRGTNLVLSVLSGKAGNGANVGLEKNDNSDSQLWLFKKAKGALYTIASYLNPSYVLDIKGGSTANGTNVRLLKSNGSKEQLFRLYSADPAKASTVNLSDGTYTVKTSGNKGYSVDIKARSTKAGANAQLAKAGSALTQRFHFDSDGKGYYVISVMGSGKVLSVKNAVVIPTNNVIQSTYTGADTQKWAIHETADGYELVNKATNLALQLSGGKYAAGTNLLANERNNAMTQRYSLSRVYLFSEGIYKISTALAKSKVIEVKGGSSKNGAALQLNGSSDTLRQRFAIERVDNSNRELYFIRTAASGGLLSFRNGKLMQYGSHSTAQHDWNTWQLVWNGTSFSFKNLASGKVLALKAGKTADGTALTTINASGKAAQHLIFDKANLLNAGTYIINSSVGTVLEVKGSSKKNGANVQMAKKSFTDGQYFVIKPTGKTSNVYVIRNRKSGLAVAVQGASIKNKGNIDQEKYAARRSQKWEARISDGGYIMFVNLNSGKALAVQGANSEPKTNAQQYQVSYSKAQKWDLKPIEWQKTGKKYTFYDTNGKKSTWTKVVYKAWNKIKKMTSGTKYLAAVDKKNLYTNFFIKQGRVWTPLKSWRCSIGPEGTPFETPTGTWKTNGVKGYLVKTGEDVYGNLTGGVNWYVYYWTIFYPRMDNGGGTGFHSLPYVPHETRIVPGVGLGQQNTGSCVRLATQNAKWVYENIKKGTTVHIYK